jgi:predicted DNA-binding antitoxin AbrB/MazE fold protein
MQVFSALVRAGTIVPDQGVELPEGSRVTVIAESNEPVELSAADEDEILESIAEADRDDVVSAADLLKRLSR